MGAEPDPVPRPAWTRGKRARRGSGHAVGVDFPDFAWSVGEEGSDPLVVHEGRTVRVDELAASGHLDRLEADLADVADLGVGVWRYGMPWRLTEPEPGKYDWTCWDRALRACEAAGLEPVVDLCHFGLPDHYPGFCEPSWVDGFVAYVEAFLDRYPSPRWFTPVNEPGITAAGSALLGAWNDRRASLADYGVALSHCVLANLRAVARVQADRDGWWIGSEGFDCPIATSPEHDTDLDETRALTRLVWDLHFGLQPRTDVASVATAVEAVDPSVLARIDALTTTHHVIAGHDLYPISVRRVGALGTEPEPEPELTIAERLDAYEHEARSWHDRYGVDFWIAETSNLGLAVDDQTLWLEAFAARLATMRDSGLPVRGLCWYSRGDQYDWDTMLTVPRGQVTEVGLFDAARRPRSVSAVFARLAAEGPPRAGHRT